MADLHCSGSLLALHFCISKAGAATFILGGRLIGKGCEAERIKG